jgi:hypothetical protein
MLPGSIRMTEEIPAIENSLRPNPSDIDQLLKNPM